MDIEKLKAAAMAATQGEWHWESDLVKDDPFNRERYQVTTTGKTITRIYYSSYEGGKTNAKDDAVFIAAANPSAVLELIERLEAVEKQRDELMAAITKTDLALEKVQGVWGGTCAWHKDVAEARAAIASVKEQDEPITVEWRCPACNTDLKHEHAYDCVAIASVKEK